MAEGPPYGPAPERPGGWAPGPPQQQWGGQPWGPQGSESSGKATASLVLGITGLLVCPIVCSVIGLILGYQARGEIDRSGGRLTGRGSAKAGIILSWIGLVLYLLLIGGVVLLELTGNLEEGDLSTAFLLAR